MNFVAVKMLVGDRAKYLGIVMGITFASLLITQQLSIFLGLMTRTFGTITDLSLPDVWVMDPKVQFIDDIKPMQETDLYRVRGIEGVQWAVPLYKGLLKVRLTNGNFQTCNVIGIDSATMIPGPPEMIEGQLSDLRRSESVIVDDVAATGKLAKIPTDAAGKEIEGAKAIPLKIGDTLEINDHRAVVVGICRVSRTFQSQPVIFTTYQRAVTFAPNERKLLSFVLAKTKPGTDAKQICERIHAVTKLHAETAEQFKWTTFMYFMKNTGIPINFGIAVVLGFIVGTAIAGQTFYSFTLENLKFFGTLKAMGAGNVLLLKMILLQAVVVGVIGYCLGVGITAFIGWRTQNSELAFWLPGWLLLFTAAVITVICVLSALLSIRRVMVLEPAIVFKG